MCIVAHALVCMCILAPVPVHVCFMTYVNICMYHGTYPSVYYGIFPNVYVCSMAPLSQDVCVLCHIVPASALWLPMWIVTRISQCVL